MSEELEITAENFDQYFFDARTHEPERGQILVRYCATAYLVDGNEKRNLLDLLEHTDKMVAMTNVMRKLFMATERDSYRVPIQMGEDLLSGMSRNEVAAKEYQYTAEMYFYTKPEYVPEDDPHWQTISLLNLDEFLDRKDSKMKSKIIMPGDEGYSEVSKPSP
jgi:hypothetical protein